MQLIFADENYEVDYELLEISSYDIKRHPKERHSLYEFNPILFNSKPKYGHEVKIGKVNEDIAAVLRKHVTDIVYHQVFTPPAVWNEKEKKSILHESIITLYENGQQEVISFAEIKENCITFVLPDIKNKASFLKDFFATTLPKYFPDFFPFSTQFAWLENQEYYLPNHEKLVADKISLKEKFDKDQTKINAQIEENKNQFAFLHDLLTETDAKLVNAVRDFLIWLEFKNVLIKDDESKSLKEEDIQITLDDGMLVIETKGIGGTSTDSDCSQIYKIKNRRNKERNKFDVRALYIVNHQRFLPPTSRQNPPFTEHQIKDALNDERGLITTWQLFTLYYQIEKKELSKAEARAQLLGYGLIKFKPTLNVNLGTPKELYKKGLVAVLDIQNTVLKIGDVIFIEKDDEFRKATIINLKLNDKSVNQVIDGEVGIELDEKITKSVVLWTQN